MRAPGVEIKASIAAAGLIALLFAGMSAAAPPRARTYFTIFVGLESPYSRTAQCLRFTADGLCISGEVCGRWSHTEPAGPETAISFRLSDDATDLTIEGRARIDNHGKGSSLAGVAIAESGGRGFNFSFAGRSTRRTRCARLVRDWYGDFETEGGDQ